MPSMAALAAMLLVLASSVHAACDPAAADAPDVATARGAIAANCDCATATSPATYKRCAKDTARATLANLGCLSTVVRCAAKSTCGRPGAAVCCKTNAAGETKGSGVRSASQCRAPRGGAACVGVATSVCDACDASGCVAPAVCGNGQLEEGEQCDGQGFCTADCHIHAVGCCQGENTCRDRQYFLSADMYFSCQPDPYVRGTCTSGTCVPLVVEPDVVCCATDAGCTTEPFSTAEGYHGPTYQCLFNRSQPMIGGVCGADDRCHPPD
ncbi:MAG TPA: hypothetical protein VGR62_24265 [Candidatus Binatia bacterium]|nr:hypothetical protein [Candidatus Binatia bacterium]